MNPSTINPLALPSVALEERSSLPTTPCIYFAIDGQGMVQYIGQSTNPKRRWASHNKGIDLALMGGVKIAYLSIDDAALLPSIEAALIHWFNPPLNTVRPFTSECFTGENIQIRSNQIRKILQDRFAHLGWTSYRLAQEVNKIRVAVFGEPTRKTSNLVTAVEKVIDDPNTSSFKNVEAAIRAMGGELVIRWKKTEEVVTGHEEINL